MMLAGVMTPSTMQRVAIGCDDCDLTGYKGRTGIYEVLVVNDSMRTAIRERGQNDVSVHGMFINTSRSFPEGAVLNLKFLLSLSGVEIEPAARFGIA